MRKKSFFSILKIDPKVNLIMEEKKKKILYLITQAEWGGAQKYIFNLAYNLKDIFDITVATGSDGYSQELVKKLHEQKIKTIILKHLKRQISLGQDLLAIKEVNYLIKKNDFEVIHLNSTKAGVIGAIAGWLNKTPQIIYTAHGWVFEEPLSPFRRWFYLLMEKISGKLRNKTIVLSEKEKNIALKNKITQKEKIFTIPNGIDLEQTFFLDKQTAKKKINNLIGNCLDSNDLVIGTIANLYPTKGLSILIESFKEILTTNPNLKLIIIGDGPAKEKLKTQINQSNLEKNIFLVGSLADAYQYLKSLDIFVLSSIKEGFPFAILEAMAAQLPIITTAIGAIPEILKNQESALFVELNNPTDLATAIKILIQNSVQAKNLAEKAHQAVTKYDLPEIIKRTSSLY